MSDLRQAVLWTDENNYRVEIRSEPWHNDKDNAGVLMSFEDDAWEIWLSEADARTLARAIRMLLPEEVAP